MFCYQCEQTALGRACEKVGVCGKTAQVSDLQDLLTYTLRGLALAAREARKVGACDPATGPFLAQALFSTLTNVNFDGPRFAALIAESVRRRDALVAATLAKGGAAPAQPAAT